MSHPLSAIGETIGIDAGTVVEYSPLQNLNHGLMQAIYLANRKIIRSFHGMDSGSKQGLIGIHVAHTGYGMLIAEQSLDRDGAPVDYIPQQPRTEGLIQRLRPQLANDFVLILHQPERPEFALIDKMQVAFAIKPEYSCSMFLRFFRRRFQQQHARHLEMQYENLTTRKIKEEILASTTYALYLLANETAAEFFGRGMVNRFAPEYVNPGKSLLRHPGHEPIFDGLNFGQFRHGYTPGR
jgi:hypothetical protein